MAPGLPITCVYGSVTRRPAIRMPTESNPASTAVVTSSAGPSSGQLRNPRVSLRMSGSSFARVGVRKPVHAQRVAPVQLVEVVGARVGEEFVQHVEPTLASHGDEVHGKVAPE